MDFGTGSGPGGMTGPQVRRIGCDNTDVRPILAVNDEGCGNRQFESWYSRAGGSGLWAWDFGINLHAQYYTGGDPANSATWAPTGDLNDNRRIEASWYSNRAHPTGRFYATQFGQIVSGPSDAVCGTTATYGTKTYTVLCLEQFIAPTMQTVAFPNNDVQKTYNMQGVRLPN